MKRLISLLMLLCLISYVLTSCNNKYDDDTNTPEEWCISFISDDITKFEYLGYLRLISYTCEEMNISEEAKEILFKDETIKMYYFKIIAGINPDYLSKFGDSENTYNIEAYTYITYRGNNKIYEDDIAIFAGKARIIGESIYNNEWRDLDVFGKRTYKCQICNTETIISFQKNDDGISYYNATCPYCSHYFRYDFDEKNYTNYYINARENFKNGIDVNGFPLPKK